MSELPDEALRALSSEQLDRLRPFGTVVEADSGTVLVELDDTALLARLEVTPLALGVELAVGADGLLHVLRRNRHGKQRIVR